MSILVFHLQMAKRLALIGLAYLMDHLQAKNILVRLGYQVNLRIM